MIRVSFFSRNVASIFCSYHQFFFSNKHRQSKRSSERIESNIPIFPLIIFHPSNVPNYFPNPLISPLISQIFSQIVYIPSTHPSTKPFPSSPLHSFPPFTIITQVVVGAWMENCLSSHATRFRLSSYIYRVSRKASLQFDGMLA